MHFEALVSLILTKETLNISIKLLKSKNKNLHKRKDPQAFLIYVVLTIQNILLVMSLSNLYRISFELNLLPLLEYIIIIVNVLLLSFTSYTLHNNFY